MMAATDLPEGAMIRPCRGDEAGTVLAIVKAAAEAYRGAIPADCWREPYMDAAELRSGIEAGIAFVGYELDGELVGVMGVQPVANVDLIRHAYVVPACQGCGIGSALIAHPCARTSRHILVGTWADAGWAIGFYERHGFRRVPGDAVPQLLGAYWTISQRQIETSVVLASPGLTRQEAERLAEGARSGGGPYWTAPLR
jgi:GNAT superfamily N-acetyltransferase